MHHSTAAQDQTAAVGRVDSEKDVKIAHLLEANKRLCLEIKSLRNDTAARESQPTHCIDRLTWLAITVLFLGGFIVVVASNTIYTMLPSEWHWIHVAMSLLLFKVCHLLIGIVADSNLDEFFYEDWEDNKAIISSMAEKVMGSDMKALWDDLPNPNPWTNSTIHMTRTTVKNWEMRCIAHIILFSLICSRYGASLAALGLALIEGFLTLYIALSQQNERIGRHFPIAIMTLYISNALPSWIALSLGCYCAWHEWHSKSSWSSAKLMDMICMYCEMCCLPTAAFCTVAVCMVIRTCEGDITNITIGLVCLYNALICFQPESAVCPGAKNLTKNVLGTSKNKVGRRLCDID